MARNRSKKPVEDDGDPGAPEWMVTFSDCMTLLLTFFVLLLSFATFDNGEFNSFSNAFGKGNKSVKAASGTPKDGMNEPQQIIPVEEVSKGSRVPSVTKDPTGNMVQQKRLTDYRNQKVFAVSSEDVFVAMGTVLNKDGKAILEDMAKFLELVPARVVISENDGAEPGKADKVGLSRACSVMEALVDKGVDRELISVTASNMLDDTHRRESRQLVITLLEEEVY
ncbi:flagellar motor protein MotB [Anaerohalosphaera lusitana]|uniref:Flagellar motor protein MotB n=1 Tax=Anaerohalosphaera lusitana TaxID=1936003 RepID=A0A1U9NG40_9BACT|nr:flagellar motor protein MotB [Anaerohalosphaera lusitana]AQT66901.1 flagellar motor protein MotB [Anaerohalosphaera lusitana]